MFAPGGVSPSCCCGRHRTAPEPRLKTTMGARPKADLARELGTVTKWPPDPDRVEQPDTFSSVSGRACALGRSRLVALPTVPDDGTVVAKRRGPAQVTRGSSARVDVAVAPGRVSDSGYAAVRNGGSWGPGVWEPRWLPPPQVECVRTYPWHARQHAHIAPNARCATGATDSTPKPGLWRLSANPLAPAIWRGEPTTLSGPNSAQPWRALALVRAPTHPPTA